MTGAVLLGALAACAIAWAAITGFAYLGRMSLALAPVRAFGAAALACLALRVAGVPIPWAVAPALLAVGLLVGTLAPLVEDRPWAG